MNLNHGNPNVAGPADNLRPGSVIGGNLRVEAMLASDETGIIVAARSLGNDRMVAVRLLLRSMSDTRFTTRIARAMRVNCVHAPRIFDLGSLGDKPYLVMDLLRGESLATVIQRGPLQVGTAVDYVVQACEALAAAHAVGVMHRKLRTSSLFLTQTSLGPCIKVLNIGTTRVADVVGDDRDDSKHVGTRAPEYVAPELFTDPHHVDARCDVWSLGVVLYELLTARRPFVGANVREVVRAIGDKAPKSARSISHAVPKKLDAILARCLEKSPSARWQTIAELALALEPFATPLTKGLPAHIAAAYGRAERALDSGGVQSSPRSSQPAAIHSSQAPIVVDDAPVRPDEAGFHKMTPDGRVLGLDSAAAVQLTRAKRVAAEADVLAREIPVLEERVAAGSIAPPKEAASIRSIAHGPSRAGSSEPPSDALARRTFMIVAIVGGAILLGVLVGLVALAVTR